MSQKIISVSKLSLRHKLLIFSEENFTISSCGNSENIYVNEIKEGRISFAHEEMEEFPLDIVKILWNDCITHLDLSGNKISNLEFLRGFIHLSSLILDGNESIGREKGLSTLPPMPKLELFYCNNCKIKYPADFVFQLSSLLTSIKYLSIMEKLTDVDDDDGKKLHRFRMFAILMNPLLLHFNEKAIQDDEREHAERYHQYLGGIDCTFSLMTSKRNLHKVVEMPYRNVRSMNSDEIEDFIESKFVEEKLENGGNFFGKICRKFFDLF